MTTLMEVPTSVVFQSTHPVRGATEPGREQDALRRISIHAPREGCDGVDYGADRIVHLFQSTHPVRGATLRVGYARCRVVISIHAPREGCDP